MNEDNQYNPGGGNSNSFSFDQVMRLIKETQAVPQKNTSAQKSPFQSTQASTDQTGGAYFPKPTTPEQMAMNDASRPAFYARMGNQPRQQQQQPQQQDSQEGMNPAQKYMTQLRQQNPNATPQQVYATLKQAKDAGLFEQMKTPNMRTGQNDKVAEAGAIAQAKSDVKSAASMKEVALGTKDVLNNYNKLLKDSDKAPSGVLESGLASAANLANMPTEGSTAQGTFEADINNLFLATIRTLKGTGRVMLSEINAIKEAVPMKTDSNAVKMAKIKSHMDYYKTRMQDLGYNAETGDKLQENTGTTESPQPTAQPPSQDEIEAEIKRRGL